MRRIIELLIRVAGGCCLVYAGWLLLRIFVCDQFIVPSDSMSPTLIAGDRILANKLVFGARIYKKFEFAEGVPLRSFRIPGTGSVQVNDVVVFNAPRGYDHNRIEFRINYVYTKRCIGTPGDSISVRDGFFYNNHYDGIIGDSLRQRLLSDTPDSLIPRRVLRAFPFDDRHYGWTIRNLGPLYVPQAGVCIALDSINWKLYRQVIEYETGDKLTCREGRVRIGERAADTYLFRNNYYSFCGDNVSDSNDCRYLGFVPEEFIIGVVRRISCSEDPYTGRRRPERWWKRVE